MSIFEQQIPNSPERDGSARPKAYERPRLIEWGTLRELTKQEKRSGLQDFPTMDGGTEVE